MKRFVYYALLPLLVSLLAVSCNQELDDPNPIEPVAPVQELKFMDVSMSLETSKMEGEDVPDTKSQVNIAVEDIFAGAALFAFDHSTGNILHYPDSSPVTCSTASKNFSWELPLDVAMDVYTVVNYNGNISGVESMLSNGSLTVSDMASLTFTCGSSAALQAMYTSSYGLPMEAINENVTLTTQNNTLSIHAKRLFAKYNFYYDASDFTSAGYTVNGLYVYGCKSNTVVPVFTEGYGQTNMSYVSMVDFGTSSDLINLQYGDSAHAVTLYFLENCQGTKSGCSNWWEVASSGLGGLNMCSYIDVGIKVTDPSGNDMNFMYWIYLGTGSGACVTDFNVVRNTSKTLKLNLKRPTSSGYQPALKALAFIDSHSTVAATYPSAGSLYFETNLGPGEITASVAPSTGNSSDISAAVTTYNSYNLHHETGLPYSGFITVTPNSDLTMTGTVTAGKYEGGGFSASDQRSVSFTGAGPTITYRMYDIVFSSNPINVGGTATATARKQKYSNGTPTGELSTASVTTWTANAPGVATINGSGVITAVSNGNATFTATDTSCESGYQSVTSSTLTVNPVVTSIWKVVTSVSTASIPVGGTATVNANLYYSNDSGGNWYYYSDVTSSGFNQIDGSGSVSISGSTITGISAGSAIIRSGHSADIYEDDTIFVTGVEPTITWRLEPSSLSFSPSSITVGGNATCTTSLIKRKYEDGVATSVTDTPSLSWDTSNSYVATVSSGTVTGTGAGSATITATDSSCEAGYQSASGIINVTSPYVPTVTWRLEPSSLSFSPSSITVGGNATCTTSLIKRKYEDGVATSVTDTPSLSWSTSNSSVATVSNGTVTGTGAGSATITATDSSCEAGYQSASGSITVTPADEFEWITTDITIDADGGSETATFRSSSSDVSFNGPGLEIAPVSWDSGTGYGTVTISASGAYSAGNTARSVTGICGSASDVLPVTVHKSSDVITYAVVIEISGSGRWSHHENVSMSARLARYVNSSFDGYEDTGYTSWSWSTDYYSDFTTTDGVSGWYGYATSTYASTYSGVLHDTSSRVEASITYQGNTYSGYTYVNFTKTYHISCSVEKQSSYGNTRVRAVLNYASPGSVIVNVYSSALGYTLEFSIPAGSTTSAYDYSLTQAQFDSLSTPYMSSSLPNGYYDDGEKAFYYFD